VLSGQNEEKTSEDVMSWAFRFFF